jgi:hypothetical protein
VAQLELSFGFKKTMSDTPSSPCQRKLAMKKWMKLPSPELITTLENQSHSEKTCHETSQKHVIEEFREKMHQAEEMVSKLAYNLREIQEAWKSR